MKKNNRIKTSKKSHLIKNKNLIKGIYSQGKGDFGFIDIEGREKGYFVFGKNNGGAFDGDRVEAELKIFRGKQEAVIINILKRAEKLIIGKYQDNNTFGFVVPKSKQIKNHIFISGKNIKDVKDGDIVGVSIKSWKGKNPEGEIREILGTQDKKELDILSIVLEGGARLKFDKKINKYLDKFQDLIPEHIFNSRKDLTKLFTFTIDGEDAKDLDDAISVEKVGNSYKLYVHIADVSHYVMEKSELDIEAYKRGTSIYLPDRVIPMLPEKLSNNLCSLNPNTKKLTLTCEMFIDTNGDIIKQNVYESVISSDFRLTYKEVDQIINKQIKVGDTLLFTGKVTQNLVEKIKLSNELKELISVNKEKKGVLNFDFGELKIELDDDKNVVEIKNYPRYNSNKIIEEFMISANESVSKNFSKLPFLYRIHEEPKQEDLESLQKTLSLFGIKFEFKKGNTKEFSDLLNIIAKQENTIKIFLEKIILRTLSKAIYSKENFGHFGLGLSFYSHFTSPIRRYPDLQIHRIIKEQIHGKLNKKRLYHYNLILDEVSNHTSSKERQAEKLEYKVKDYFIVNYYKDKIGNEYEAIISGMIPKGFFVALENMVEGFIGLERGEFNEQLQEHIDLKSGNKYRLGDSVSVKLTSVDFNLLRLNFEIV